MMINTDRLARLSEISTSLYNGYDPHNPGIYLDRAELFAKLGFHDLATADSYRALSLLECVIEPESAEYTARRRIGYLQQEEDFAENHKSILGRHPAIVRQIEQDSRCAHNSLLFVSLV